MASSFQEFIIISLIFYSKKKCINCIPNGEFQYIEGIQDLQKFGKSHDMITVHSTNDILCKQMHLGTPLILLDPN
jgi:hypothetical protein